MKRSSAPAVCLHPKPWLITDSMDKLCPRLTMDGQPRHSAMFTHEAIKVGALIELDMGAMMPVQQGREDDSGVLSTAQTAGPASFTCTAYISVDLAKQSNPPESRRIPGDFHVRLTQ